MLLAWSQPPFQSLLLGYALGCGHRGLVFGLFNSCGLWKKILDFIYLIFGCNDLSSEVGGLLQKCSVDVGDDFKRWLKCQIWYNSQIDQGVVFEYCSVPRLMFLFNPSARVGGLLRKQDETLLCLWFWVLPGLQDAVKRIASVLLGGRWVSFARGSVAQEK